MSDTIIDEDTKFQAYYEKAKQDQPRVLALVARKVDLVAIAQEHQAKLFQTHCSSPIAQAHPTPATGSKGTACLSSSNGEGDISGLEVQGRIPWDKFFKFLTFIAIILVIAAAGGSIVKYATTGGFVIVAGAESTNNTTHNQTAEEANEASWHPAPVDHLLIVIGWSGMAIILTAWFWDKYYRKESPTAFLKGLIHSLDALYANPTAKAWIDQEWDKTIKPALDAEIEKLLGDSAYLDKALELLKQWGAT
jgi:hypothetical protein